MKKKLFILILVIFLVGCSNTKETVSKTVKLSDNGIFSKYYSKATRKLESMTLDEKISQILLVRYPDVNQKNILKEYQFGGYIFFSRDFKNKSKQDIIDEINNLQEVSKIPLLTAVDEEGGIVARVSSSDLLRAERFKSPRDLYEIGGLDRIKEDNIEKNKLLKELGLNLNLAPVVDIATSTSDYMYSRSLGEDSETTSKFVEIILSSSKESGVSNSLKHFPGYGNNADTHNGISVDTRSYDSIMNNDLLPFKEGINDGAESILVSHNIVSSIDKDNPASLSKSIHKLLRKDLNFTGVIITDDLDMGAIKEIDNATVKAVLAGNDLIITTDYEESINAIRKALLDQTIKEEELDRLVLRVLAWKYYKKLM